MPPALFTADQDVLLQQSVRRLYLKPDGHFMKELARKLGGQLVDEFGD